MRTQIKTERKYRELLRHIASVLVFLFACMTVVASTHHHDNYALPVQVSTITRTLVASGAHSNAVVQAASTAAKSELPSLSDAGCALCDWMATTSHPSSAIAVSLFIALSLIACLMLVVRIAALCAVPAPRRGLRAPPAALLA